MESLLRVKIFSHVYVQWHRQRHMLLPVSYTYPRHTNIYTHKVALNMYSTWWSANAFMLYIRGCATLIAQLQTYTSTRNITGKFSTLFIQYRFARDLLKIHTLTHLEYYNIFIHVQKWLRRIDVVHGFAIWIKNEMSLCEWENYFLFHTSIFKISLADCLRAVQVEMVAYKYVSNEWMTGAASILVPESSENVKICYPTNFLFNICPLNLLLWIRLFCTSRPSLDGNGMTI